MTRLNRTACALGFIGLTLLVSSVHAQSSNQDTQSDKAFQSTSPGISAELRRLQDKVAEAEQDLWNLASVVEPDIEMIEAS